MDFLEVCGLRRSIRIFRPWEQVERAKIQRILEVARTTTCPGNLQPWRAIVAVAHSILVSAYCLLSRHEPYRELGGDYFDRLRPETTAKRLMRRLENLGYKITLQAPAQEALASG